MNLQSAATTIGLDAREFGACLGGHATSAVDADVDLAETLSVEGTPTWFIGSVHPDGKVRVTDRLDGAKPLAEFHRIIGKAAP